MLAFIGWGRGCQSANYIAAGCIPTLRHTGRRHSILFSSDIIWGVANKPCYRTSKIIIADVNLSQPHTALGVYL